MGINKNVRRSMKIPCYNCEFSCDRTDKENCEEYIKFMKG